jgi:Recombinase
MHFRFRCYRTPVLHGHVHAAGDPHGRRLHSRVLAWPWRRCWVGLAAFIVAAALGADADLLGGYRGRQTVSTVAGRAALQRNADAFAAKVKPMVAELRGQGLSLRQIASALAERGISTRRGGPWTAPAVLAVLKRSV